MVQFTKCSIKLQKGELWFEMTKLFNGNMYVRIFELEWDWDIYSTSESWNTLKGIPNREDRPDKKAANGKFSKEKRHKIWGPFIQSQMSPFLRIILLTQCLIPLSLVSNHRNYIQMSFPFFFDFILTQRLPIVNLNGYSRAFSTFLPFLSKRV